VTEPARQLTLHTPLGEVTVSEASGGIVALDWGRGARQESSPLLREAARQLNAYFDDRLERFDLPLKPHGTPFQFAVWKALRRIPKGETRTYGELAQLLGSSARAIGSACARNPIPIIVPCHRVTAATGKLGGFSGGDGLATKLALLRLERAILT
jgi:methylated-DNA-[protein]-cysteine S-methyltransferase